MAPFQELTQKPRAVFRGGCSELNPSSKWIRSCYKSLKCIKIHPKPTKPPNSKAVIKERSSSGRWFQMDEPTIAKRTRGSNSSPLAVSQQSEAPDALQHQMKNKQNTELGLQHISLCQNIVHAAPQKIHDFTKWVRLRMDNPEGIRGIFPTGIWTYLKKLLIV